MLEYPIKGLKVGEVLDVAIRLARDHFKELFLVTCFLALPFHVIENTVGYLAADQLEAEETDLASIFGNTRSKSPLAAVEKILNAVDRLVVEPLTTGALIFMAAAIYLGKKVTPREALSMASKRWGSLVGAAILYGLIVIFGTILLIVPGIYWALKYGLYEQLIMVEGCTASNFMDRSGALMKNNMGDAMILGFLYVCIIFGCMIGIAFIPFAPLNIVLTAIVETGAELIGTAIFVVFYFSCRCKNENFDLTVLAKEAATDDAPPPQEPLPQ